MELRGAPVDERSRCRHWSSDLDIVAFRFPCCEGWWPCRSCHDEATDHEAVPWPRDRWAEPAVACGACGDIMTIEAYRACEHACPACQAAFNPGCKDHWPAYFEA